MAVPKKKQTPSRQGMRRSHDALKKINAVIDKDSGEYRRPHHMCSKDGTYKGRQIINKKTSGEVE